MTQEEYDAILAYQGGVCRICRKPPAPGKNLHVDHDHAPAKACDPKCDHPHEQSCSNCWRGLVHRHCNDLLSIVRDDEVILLQAVDFLRDPPAQQWRATLAGDELLRTVISAGTTEAKPGSGPDLLRSGHELPVRSRVVAAEDPLCGS